MSDDLQARFRDATRTCPVVGWRRRETPASTFAALAGVSEELGLDTWDGYGAGGPVERLEAEVAELLGKPAAVFVVSGVMAQQAVLRTWCERTGSMRVAIPDLAHQLKHEQDGPRLLHGFRFEWLTQGAVAPSADGLEALGPGLGAVQVELPLRHAGCLLPTWDELAGLSAACREQGVPLHVDGARLWESQPFYDRPLAEIAALADSVYVSFYKGLGGLAGAAVAADEDVVAEVRRWRARMGGTIFRMTPYAVAALAGLRDRLPQMGEYVAWARALAAALVERGLTVRPDPPHTNTFQVSAVVDPDLVTERLIDPDGRRGGAAVLPVVALGRRPGRRDRGGRRARGGPATRPGAGGRLVRRARPVNICGFLESLPGHPLILGRHSSRCRLGLPAPRRPPDPRAAAASPRGRPGLQDEAQRTREQEW